MKKINNNTKLLVISTTLFIFSSFFARDFAIFITNTTSTDKWAIFGMFVSIAFIGVSCGMGSDENGNKLKESEE